MPTHSLFAAALTGCAFAATCSTAFASELSKLSSRPNVVIIYVDDMGFGDASCLNPEAKFKTPNLDRLAREGISFTNAHCSDTVCTPSRYGLLTGRYCWRTSRKKGVMGAEGECLITDDRMTIASMLSGRDYATAMIGKWHLGMTFTGDFGRRDWSEPITNMPLDKGFDYFYGIPASLNFGALAWIEGRHAKVPPTQFTAKKPNNRHVDYRIKPPYLDSLEAARKQLGNRAIEVAPDFVDQECLTRFTDRAIGWMKRHLEETGDDPFFVYLPFTSPHYPVCPKPEFWGQGDCGGYGEFMIETDFHVGRVMEFLKQQKIDENTLVLFTSDNGPEKSWKGRVDEFGHRSNAGLRGGKRDIYEGGHRVPLLVRWPRGIANPGRACDHLIGQTDVLATLADIVGAELPSDAAEDSISFVSLLQSSDAEHSRPALINHGYNGRFAVTDGAWKLIMPHGKNPFELYDLSTDRSETTNVASQNPDRVAQLTKTISDTVCVGRTRTTKTKGNDTGYWNDLTWMTEKEYDLLAE